MKIGELSEASSVPTRMLRYYEEKGLISSSRLPNGYRDYETDQIQRAIRARSLIKSGLSTRIARLVLEFERNERVESYTEAFGQELKTELTAIEERIDCLKNTRVVIEQYLRDHITPTEGHHR
ncbi:MULTISPECIES: MerR family DNA-binding transcriptional regulator [unclassified Corynebacterium]|uniref:MerR family DNA-binding transcriptional regulator n=1 Tax=unclassified Corynebacterium TaxID=2624378 RepID=UPI0029CA552E|nr:MULTISPECIES: MerR family DNA-binding transcriptional regulator [unclassified Corynebacterium]WPF65406.1 MerR family DNA-binding transcriptional regulator [Corynebacterium sp. 22KM0430]WPF67901.1 MerR family DNA-binding transcriptional regulator [Corynebacterium sp. 21KM1197]